MINADTEQLIPFVDAPEVIPGHPDLSQVYRWAMRGLRGVKLEFIRIGGRRFTSKEALNRFYAALTEADQREAVSA